MPRLGVVFFGPHFITEILHFQGGQFQFEHRGIPYPNAVVLRTERPGRSVIVVSTYQKVARIGKIKRESKGFITVVFAMLGGFFCSAVSLNPRRVVLGGHGY